MAERGRRTGQHLTAAHLLGFGAIMLSGERCHDEPLRAALNVGADEVLAGFISIGSIAKAPPVAARPARERVWSSWSPTEEHATSSACASIPVTT